MAIEYLGLNSVNGPFVVLEGVKGAAYDEIVEIVADGKEKKLGRIVEINEDKAVVQVFEGTDNLSLKNTHTRLTGHPMEIGLTDQLLGRTFNGIGAPIDNLGEVAAERIPSAGYVCAPCKAAEDDGDDPVSLREIQSTGIHGDAHVRAEGG